MLHDIRPRLCPDKDCTPIIRNETDEYFEKGGSFDCFGKRKEPFVYKFREVVHSNDMNHCCFLPHGILNFKENTGDIANVASLLLRVLVETGQKTFCPGWFWRSHVEIDKKGLLHVNDNRRGRWHCCWHHNSCTRDINPNCNGTSQERDLCSYWKEVGGV